MHNYSLNLIIASSVFGSLLLIGIFNILFILRLVNFYLPLYFHNIMNLFLENAFQYESTAGFATLIFVCLTTILIRLLASFVSNTMVLINMEIIIKKFPHNITQRTIQILTARTSELENHLLAMASVNFAQEIKN